MFLVKRYDRNRAARAVDCNGLAASRHRFEVEDGWISRARRCLEGVAEAVGETVSGRLVHPDRNSLALEIGKGAQIIDSMRLVCMIMGHHHAIDPPDAGRQHLFAEIR